MSKASINTKARVLLVEDNPRIQAVNAEMLGLMGYDVCTALNIAQARSCIAEGMPDIIVLDIMLPDGSGLDFLQALRKRSFVPVLLLTALGSSEDTIRGLAAGADDYLAKPYDYNVLAARIEALLRRSGRVNESIRRGPLELDIIAMRALLNGEDMLLKPKEFLVLLLLAQHQDRRLTPRYLYENVWKMPMADSNQALRTIISRLRSKLADSGYTITSQRTEGYLLEPEI